MGTKILWFNIFSIKWCEKYEKGKTLLQNVKDKAKLSDEEIEKIEDKIYTKFD